MRVWVALATIYVVWGSTFAGIELAVRTLPPFLAMSARHLVAGALLLAWGLARGPRERIGGRQLVAATVFGGALFLGGRLLDRGLLRGGGLLLRRLRLLALGTLFAGHRVETSMGCGCCASCGWSGPG